MLGAGDARAKETAGRKCWEGHEGTAPTESQDRNAADRATFVEPPAQPFVGTQRAKDVTASVLVGGCRDRAWGSLLSSTHVFWELLCGASEDTVGCYQKSRWNRSNLIIHRKPMTLPDVEPAVARLQSRRCGCVTAIIEPSMQLRVHTAARRRRSEGLGAALRRLATRNLCRQRYQTQYV